MNRKKFLATSALGMGAIFQIPFTGSSMPAENVYEAFTNSASQSELYDVIIVGGSFAGLSAAMGLGRCLRKVLVINEGLARNRTSPQANNLFSRDGENPAEIHQIAKKQLQQYREYLSMIAGKVQAVEAKDSVFQVTHENGSTYQAQRIVFASGVTDNLQEISGLEELWGRGVYHCPYCHGWENRGKKTVVIGVGTQALGLASSVSHWASEITYFSQGVALDLPEQSIRMLQSAGITVSDSKVSAIKKVGNKIHIQLERAEEVRVFEACYAPGVITANSALATSLGCTTTRSGSIEVNEQYMSSIEHVYAIGDVCNRSNGQVVHAAYSGTVVAAAINNDFLRRRFS